MGRRSVAVVVWVLVAAVVAVASGSVGNADPAPLTALGNAAVAAAIEKLEGVGCLSAPDLAALHNGGMPPEGASAPVICVEGNAAQAERAHGWGYSPTDFPGESGITLNHDTRVAPAKHDLAGGDPQFKGSIEILAATLYHEHRHYTDDDPSHAVVHENTGDKLCELATAAAEEEPSDPDEVRNICKAMEGSIYKAKRLATEEGADFENFGDLCDVCTEVCSDDDRESGNGGDDDEDPFCICGGCPEPLDPGGGDGDAPAWRAVSVPTGSPTYMVSPLIRDQIDAILTDQLHSPVFAEVVVGVDFPLTPGGLDAPRSFTVFTETAELHISRWNPAMSPYGGPGAGATQKLVRQLDYKPYAICLVDDDSVIVAGRAAGQKTVVRQYDFDLSQALVSLTTSTVYFGDEVGVLTGLEYLPSLEVLIGLDASGKALWRFDMGGTRAFERIAHASTTPELLGKRGLQARAGVGSASSAEYSVFQRPIREGYADPIGGYAVIADYEVMDSFVDDAYEVTP